MTVIASEVNTGGGSMVTIIKCDLWDYCLVTNDESVAVYKQEDHFWEGEDPIEFTYVNRSSLNWSNLFLNHWSGE